MFDSRQECQVRAQYVCKAYVEGTEDLARIVIEKLEKAHKSCDPEVYIVKLYYNEILCEFSMLTTKRGRRWWVESKTKHG